MARPKSSDPRSITVPVRFTAAEREELAAAVENSHCSGVSDYLRRRALGHRIASKVDLNTVNELRRMGGLVKHGITQDPAHAEDYRKLLASINAAIGRLGRA